MSQELIDALSKTPTTLANLVAEADDARLDAAPEAEWSARLVLAHLRDLESLDMRRAIESMLAFDNPELSWTDAALWQASRNTTRDRKEHLLGDFALQRRASVALLQAMRPEDWQRTCAAPDGSGFDIASLVAGWVSHDREHIAQLESLLGESLDEVLARRARPPE